MREGIINRVKCAHRRKRERESKGERERGTPGEKASSI